MSLTVTDQSKYLYSNYLFQNSSTYTDSTVDTSGVSQDDFNISDLTNALDALDSSNSANFDTISGTASYAKNTYLLSQLDSYDELSSSSNVIRMLTGDASADNIYDILETQSEIETDTALSSITSSSSSSSSSSYISYIENSDSVLNLLA